MEGSKLVNVTLNGFLEAWDPFIRGVRARDKLPTFDKLRDDCILEEIRLLSKGKINNSEDNENIAPMAKGKGKSSSRSEELTS